MEDLGLRALYRRVAGIDVHRMLHVVTVLIEQADGSMQRQTREFGGFSAALLEGTHAVLARLRIELGQPSHDAAQLGLLLRERLSRCEMPAPVYGLKLRLDDAVALAGHAAALPFGSDHSGARWHDAALDAENFLALLDRLSARLGAQHVQRWVPRADHRPEKAARSLSASDAPARAVDAPPLPRPAWLLPEPLRLAEHEGRPVHGGALVLRSRPERIEAGWFDGAPACRDYHVAVGRDQRLRWVFHERRGALSTPSGWFLHGLFT